MLRDLTRADSLVSPARDDQVPSDSRHQVIVEIILLRLRLSNTAATDARRPRLAYRTLAQALPTDDVPDDLARQLAHVSRTGPRVVHSTSWRYQPGRGVVLTYAVLPDPEPDLPARPLDEPAVVCSGDPLRPAPAALHEHHVVAHAVRHLADLALRDPGIAATTGDPALAPLWTAIAEAASRTPTATHDVAHRQAHLHERDR